MNPDNNFIEVVMSVRLDIRWTAWTPRAIAWVEDSSNTGNPMIDNLEIYLDHNRDLPDGHEAAGRLAVTSNSPALAALLQIGIARAKQCLQSCQNLVQAVPAILTV